MRLVVESSARRARLLVREHARVDEGRCIFVSCDREGEVVLMPRFPASMLTDEERDAIEVRACEALGLAREHIRACVWIAH